MDVFSRNLCGWSFDMVLAEVEQTHGLGPPEFRVRLTSSGARRAQCFGRLGSLVGQFGGGRDERDLSGSP